MVNHRAPWDYPTQRQVATLEAAANAPACEKLGRGAAISAWKKGGASLEGHKKADAFSGSRGKAGLAEEKTAGSGKKDEAILVSGPRGGSRCWLQCSHQRVRRRG